MNTKKIFLLVFFIGVSGLVFYFANAKKTSSFPNPKFVPLEEQKVVGFYDWVLIGPTAVEKSMYADQDNVILIHMWDVNDPNVIEELESLQFLEKTIICISGADFSPTLNQTKINLMSFLVLSKTTQWFMSK